MTNENTYLVLGASRYNFEQNGQTIRGCKVRYIPNEDTKDDNNVGLKIIEMNTDFDNFEMFNEGTGLYDLGFVIVPGSRGVPKMLLTSARLIKKIDLMSVINTRKAA